MSKQQRTRWSDLPKWAWAHGLRKNVHFRAEADTDYAEAAAVLPDPTTDINDAQVITSKIEYHDKNPDLGMHRPILDIDFPAQLIPSSTEGHFHLYLDKPMDWPTYAKLLRALSEAGIIEPGYARASEARKYTAVRLPWVHKEDAPDEELPDDQPEVELVDRVANEAPATIRGASATTTAFDEAHAILAPNAARRSPIQAPEQNEMREPLTDDISRMVWQSPHRAIAYYRLYRLNSNYQTLLEEDPTTGNPLWREACRVEQRRQNRERAERAERQEARVRREHEERQRMLSMDRIERQAQQVNLTPFDTIRPTPTGWLRPRQAPFELVYSPADRTVRDNRGRQLTEEGLYRAQSDLRMNPSDLQGPRMEEMWERCYEYAMSRRLPRPADRSAHDAILDLAAAYAPQTPSQAPSVAPAQEDAAE